MQYASNVPANSSRTVGVVRGAIRSSGWVLGFVLLLAISAQVKFPLPFTPVPVTMQTLVVIMAGVVLGPWLGLSAVAAYLAAGVIGLPVFAGPSGLSTLSGATGGYLISFLVATPMVGVLSRRNSDWTHLLMLALLAHVVILAMGATWLGVWGQMTFSAACALGVVPFIPGTILKTAIAALLTSRMIRR